MNKNTIKRIFKREPDIYNAEYERQLSYESKTETSGFVPRHIEIKRMYAQGELNTIMKEYSESKIRGDDVSELEVGLSNLKNLDTVELMEVTKQRLEKYRLRKQDLDNSLLEYYNNVMQARARTEIEKQE